jgi:hypothetical protein
MTGWMGLPPHFLSHLNAREEVAESRGEGQRMTTGQRGGRKEFEAY